MPVNEALLHNWFYGNYGVRIAGAVIFAFLISSIPTATIARWLFGSLDSRLSRTANALVPPANIFKGFLAIIVAVHGGGEYVGLYAAFAGMLGHYFSPWRRFRGGDQIDYTIGIAAALNPASAIIVFFFWAPASRVLLSPAIGTLLAGALLFLPLWFFVGAPAALLGIAGGAVIALRVGFGQPLESLEIEELDRSAPARSNQTALLQLE
jgi:glycerol-3-phosphate acyltransferase PlsY